MLRVILFSLFFTPLAWSCPIKFNEAGLCAKVTWISGPFVNQVSWFKVSFWAAGDPLKRQLSPEQEVRIYTYMKMNSGHHHEGPRVHPVETDLGVFDVSDARFTMGPEMGEWFIFVDLYGANGEIQSRGSQTVLF